MRLINVLPVVAQLAQLAYAQEPSVSTSTKTPSNALDVFYAALKTLLDMDTLTESGRTVTRTWIKPGAPTITKIIELTVPPSSTGPPTVTSTRTVTRGQEYTEPKQKNGIPLTWSNALSNATSETEATTPAITAGTQPGPAESYDLRSFPTDVSAVTLTKGGPEPALTVTESAQNGKLSTITVAPTVWVTETAFADETSSLMQAYSTNTFPNATSVSDAIDSATGLANTGDAMGLTTLTSTASKASATSTITLTDTDLVIPVQANNTQPISVPFPSPSPYEGNPVTGTMASPVNSPTDEPMVSIQPLGTAPALPSPSGVTAYDSIRIPHGHPPLVTGDRGHRSWNMSTNCTESRTQKVPGTGTAPSSFSTSTTSRVFIGYPPALSGYSNGTGANASTIRTDSSAQTVLGTAPAVTHVEIPPPPTAPLNSCSPGIWGRPGCLSTPTSFLDAASTTVDHQDHQPAVSAATLAEIPPPPTVPLDSCTTGIWGRPGCLSTPASFFESSTQAQLSTASAATHVEIPPPPTIPLDSCSPGIWGRPGCLSTPTSFFDAASTPASPQEQQPTVSAVTLAEIPPPPTVPLDSCKTGIWGRPGCLTIPTSFFDAVSTPSTPQAQDSTTAPETTAIPATTEPQALTATPNNSTIQPSQAQCTTTFYSLPTSACTHTVYASKKTVTINCLGCVGHHALPSFVSNGGSACHNSMTVTQPCTTRTMCGFPETNITASGSFVTSVTSTS